MSNAMSDIYIFYSMQPSLQASDFILGFLLSQALAVRFILQTHLFAKWIVSTWGIKYSLTTQSGFYLILSPQPPPRKKIATWDT